MFCRILILSVTLMMLFVSSGVASDNPMMVRVDLIDKSDLTTLAGLHFDIAYVEPEFAEAVVYPDRLSELADAGLHYQIIHDDLVQFYQSRNPVGTTMGGFLTFPEILDTIDALHANFPALVSARDSIGATWEGRALWEFKISDNVDTDEDEPEVFFNSLIHAREPASWSWQLHFINWLLTNYGFDPTATEIINERELYFLPVINPDGYEYNRQTSPNGGGMWRKNRRAGGGVDLNRNWGYMWGYDNNGSSPYSYDEDYRGPSAFSEPETQALRDFIISRDFKFIINAHTYGDYFLYPWGYADIFTPDQPTFQLIGDSAEVLTNHVYISGTAWQLLYNTNGESTDWQYGEQTAKPKIFAAVVESGSDMDGFWPSTYRIPVINSEMLPVGIYIAQLAGNIGAIAPPAAPVLNPIGVVHTDTFTVSWTHDDPDNPAVAYELVEKSGLTRIEDDFESGPTNWQLSGFTLSTTRYYSATHSLFSGRQNNYSGSAIMNESFMVEAGDTLTFYIWYDIENGYDYAYVELSTDGGQNYEPIPGNITTNYNPHNNNRGNGITGTSSGWVQGIFPLEDYVDSSVTIKFSYSTDPGVLGDGAYIDDVFPLESFEHEQILASDIAEASYLVEVQAEGTYYYQVRARDAQNQWSVFSNREVALVQDIVAVDDNFNLPSVFELRQNYPNPFNAQTIIDFSLASPGFVALDIYDLAGRHVRNLVRRQLEAGNHQVVWNGEDDSGRPVASGVYFYTLSGPANSLTRKLTLLK